MGNTESLTKDIGVDCPIGNGIKRFICHGECVEEKKFYIFFCESQNCTDGKVHCEFHLCSEKS